MCLKSTPNFALREWPHSTTAAYPVVSESVPLGLNERFLNRSLKQLQTVLVVIQVNARDVHVPITLHRFFHPQDEWLNGIALRLIRRELPSQS